ncbi:MAG: DMT family transporter [Pseudomonadota bacterium]
MQNRPLAAAGSILAGMAIIGFIDQYVSVIAETSSLWTFHLLRSFMMFALAGLFLLAIGRRLRVVNWPGLLGRSALNSTAMIIYFGSLGFMPVAQAAAGLFTAPLWILVFSGVLFGLRVGPVLIMAVALGFLGVLLVLSPDPAQVAWVSFVPVAAGAFYGIAAIATREWCGQEDPLALTLGIFGFLAIWGVVGIVLMGPGDSFLSRGWVAPSGQVWGFIALQAVGSLVAVVLLTQGYLLAEASLASVFEFSVLGFSALFGWLVLGQVTGPIGLFGLVLIALAGSVIAFRGERAAA